MLEIRGAFEAGATGSATVLGRSRALDTYLSALWRAEVEGNAGLGAGIALVAVGGYGRSELYPFSDVDLLFLLDGKLGDGEVKDPVRRVNQELWDSGMRASPVIRRVAECERYDKENAEFTLSLLDHRYVAGDAATYEKLAQQTLPKLRKKERRNLLLRIAEMTRDRHAKYGGTLFHLEPSIKECPGGLRDVHVCRWIDELEPDAAGGSGEAEEFSEAVEFLRRLRCFLHYRHGRDDNTLDWHSQDAAAAALLGLPSDPDASSVVRPDASYWMRLYFRHARSVERRTSQELDRTPQPKRARPEMLFRVRQPKVEVPEKGYRVEQGRLLLDRTEGAELDPACDPHIVLQVFGTLARVGCRLSRETELRLAQALPMLSTHLEEGPTLWTGLREVLTGRFAGDALRSMHALGVLELLIPEFHGIDALVIRDAYHRYTVDEHTFVVVDTLHGLKERQAGAMAEWSTRFSVLLRELPHPELLFLVALLHDTGKGRNSGDHAKESVQLARGVLQRLELDEYESSLVLEVIVHHLEMSAALRRDIFDAETVSTFAAKVSTPEALRMLSLFTYADIQAVHADALTPWKAENLWHLYIAAANYLDRNVDEERVDAREARKLVDRVAALHPGQRKEIAEFLEGFPERYVRTRSPEQMRAQFVMAERLRDDTVQIEFKHATGVSEITLVTPDRRLLFANMAGVLSAWGMNIVTAEAFSNLQGVVVDTFRFTDTFRTLEMNASEHARFLESVHDVMTGQQPLEKLLNSRRRGKRKPPLVTVDTRVDFPGESSSHSTLVEVVAQDSPGLLRAISSVLADRGCNIEVALIDTEGESAIDVFYVTRDGRKLDEEEQHILSQRLLEAIEGRER